MRPGDFHFGEQNTRIKTLLGSCVSITLWHPTRLIGGMCHYMLPTRGMKGGELDGRYADEAMALFLQKVRQSNTHPCEYEVKLFGGGNMFPNIARGGGTGVPEKNVEMGRALVSECGCRIAAENLGGMGHRQIIFDIWSGHVWVRQAPVAE